VEVAAKRDQMAEFVHGEGSNVGGIGLGILASYVVEPGERE